MPPASADSGPATPSSDIDMATTTLVISGSSRSGTLQAPLSVTSRSRPPGPYIRRQPRARQPGRPAISNRSCRLGLRSCRTRNSPNRCLNSAEPPSRSASARKSRSSDTARSYSRGFFVSISSAASRQASSVRVASWSRCFA